MDDDFLKLATEFLLAVTGELDNYTEEKGEIVSNGKDEVYLLTPSHIQFAYAGRGPGKSPPLNPILEWVKSKNIGEGIKEQKGTAFAIMRSIKEKGTKNWIPNAPNIMQVAINNNLQKYFDGLNKDIFKVQQEEIDGIFRKEFPEGITFKI